MICSILFYFILFYFILFYFILLKGTLVTDLIFASNLRINLFQYVILGPTTAAAMASSKKWKQLVLPALLTGMIYIILPHPTLLNSSLHYSTLFYAFTLLHFSRYNFFLDGMCIAFSVRSVLLSPRSFQ